MCEQFRISTSETSCEIIIKRSRFIARTYMVNTTCEVKPIIEKLRKEYAGCSHVVYAFSIGDINSQTLGMSDDGEPKGTAGRPVLEVLKGSCITNTLVAVIRYFGGIKLGTGGLVKAYTESAQLALSEIKTKDIIAEISFTTAMPYSIYEPSKKQLIDLNGTIHNEIFDSAVTIDATIPEEKFDEFCCWLQNISNGSVHCKIKK